MSVSPSPQIGRCRLGAVAAGGAVVTAIGGAAVAAAFRRGHSGDVANAIAAAVVIGTIAAVGAVIALAVPKNRVGWLLLAGASTWGVAEALVAAGERGVLQAPGSVRGATYFAAVGPALRGVGYLLTVVVVPAVFPDGHLPGRKWRWLPWSASAAVVCLFLGGVLDPHAQDTRLAQWRSPLGVSTGLASALSLIALLLTLATAVGAVTGLAARWRSGGRMVRQQLLLFAVAACVPAAALSVVIATPLPPWAFAVAVVPLPIAIGTATLAHGLFDLRRAANLTLLWLIMSGCVIVIYALVVSAAAALTPHTRAWWLPAFAAAIAALLLLPARESIQRGATRVVYGRWREPYEVLADLGGQLEAAADMDRLIDAAVSELTTGLGLGGVSVRANDEPVVVGADIPARTTLPLQAYGVTVGWMSYQAPDRGLSTTEERLVHDLARHLGGALHARRLRDDLQSARERLVLAREEERRRLRRDLHDGLGPALAGLTLKSETAQALLPPGAEAARRQLHELTEDIRQTVIDVRRVVEGLRPPALDELGLVAALTRAIERLTAATSIHVTMNSPGSLPPLPAAVEVAAYRILVEAVTNVVRHARASHCDVELACTSRELIVTVTDDGDGLAASNGDGNGLTIMRERAEELGGQTSITGTSPGVAVQARLPIQVSPVSQPLPALRP